MFNLLYVAAVVSCINAFVHKNYVEAVEMYSSVVMGQGYPVS